MLAFQAGACVRTVRSEQQQAAIHCVDGSAPPQHVLWWDLAVSAIDVNVACTCRVYKAQHMHA